MKSRVEAAHQAHLTQLKQLENDLTQRHEQELVSLRSQYEEYAHRSQARVAAELQATKQKLEHAMEEIDRIKRESKQDTQLTAQVAQLRQENADLQRNLSFTEER
jgi:predicted RNase H-like nuclease (RuvC/YqgF family)